MAVDVRALEILRAKLKVHLGVRVEQVAELQWVVGLIDSLTGLFLSPNFTEESLQRLQSALGLPRDDPWQEGSLRGEIGHEKRRHWSPDVMLGSEPVEMAELPDVVKTVGNMPLLLRLNLEGRAVPSNFELLDRIAEKTNELLLPREALEDEKFRFKCDDCDQLPTHVGHLGTGLPIAWRCAEHVKQIIEAAFIVEAIAWPALFPSHSSYRNAVLDEAVKVIDGLHEKLDSEGHDNSCDECVHRHSGYTDAAAAVEELKR